MHLLLSLSVNLFRGFATNTMFRLSTIRFFIIALGLLCGYSYGQTQDKDSILAATFFESENYSQALKSYLKLYQSNKTDSLINYRIGYCYLQVNDDKSKAIPYFEYVYSSGKYKDDLLLNMGRAYMHAYNFEDALTFFNHYRTIIYSKKFELLENYYEDCMEGKIDYQKKITSHNFGLVDHLIENCESAIELFKNPVNVSFENLGPEINSKYADYYPFITKDEGRLYFTSRRPLIDSVSKWQIEIPADIYSSRVSNGDWMKASKLGTINTAEDEECVFISPEGKSMIVYQDNENASGDISIVGIDSALGQPESFSGPINTQFREFEGCITEDGNAVIFSSDRDGGLGETDLYIVKKLPNGQWSIPLNLGPNVNTQYKEAFPVFDEKNNILYFSSEGHVNMGGFDIFSSMLDTSINRFEPAFNMGYPINTPDNDMQFSLSENKREGYIAAIRKEGLGDYDIYKLVFNAIEKRPSVIRGLVSIKDGDTLRKEIVATISIKDAISNKELDSKKVNFQTGRYIFAVDNPGKYILTVKSPDFRNLEQEINLYDKSDYAFEIENDFLLQKKAVNVVPTSNSSSDTTQTYSLNKLPVNVIIWGVIKTNIPVEADINASIVVRDALTSQDIIKKNANPKSGKYSFSVSPGKYTINVTSPGYEPFSEEINTENLSDISETGKNITLARIFHTEKKEEQQPKITEKDVKNILNKMKKTDVVKDPEHAKPVNEVKNDTVDIKAENKDTIPSEKNADQPSEVIENQNDTTILDNKEPVENETKNELKKAESLKKNPSTKAPAKKAAGNGAKKPSKPTGATKKGGTSTKKTTTTSTKSTAKKPASSTNKKSTKPKSSAKFN